MIFNVPKGKQRRAILGCDRRLNIFDGSVRSGKTVGSVISWLDYLDTGPPGPLLMIGKTERTLTRNVLHPIAELVGSGDYNLRSGAGECSIFGRRVMLVGANDERSEQKIRGLTLAGAYGDEVTTWPESFFTMLLSRLSLADARFFGTTNPDSPMHWLMTGYLQREEELSLRRWHFTLDDNPNLDPAFVAAIKQEYRGLWYRRFILGEWCVAEGAVYDMLDFGVNVVQQMPELVRHWVGIDYGTSNPTVFLMLSQGVDGRMYFHHEYRWDPARTGRQKTDPELSRDYRVWAEERLRENKVAPERVFYDPSAASFGLQLYRDDVKRLAPADNAVLEGIRNVSGLLGSGVLAFHEPTTRDCLAEMTSYAWDTKAQQKGEDKPIKVKDHGPDSVRYSVRGAWAVCRRVLSEWLLKQRRN